MCRDLGQFRDIPLAGLLTALRMFPELFGAPGAAVHELGPPSEEQRAAFFEAIARTLAFPPPPQLPRQQRTPLQVLT